MDLDEVNLDEVELDEVELDEGVLEKAIFKINRQLPKDYIIIPYDSIQHRNEVLELNEYNKNEGCAYDLIQLSQYALLMIHIPTQSIVSYLFFSIHDQENFLGLDISCTSVAHRNLGLSTYLRLVLFLYAIYTEIPFITSDANESSFNLLRKFGFNGTIGNYLEEFDWKYTVFVNTQNPLFLNSVQQKLF